MFLNAFKLFITGKLFREPKKVLQMSAAGIFIAAALCLIMVVAGLPLVVAIFTSSFIGGLLQPFLFKNIRYR